MNQEGFLAEGDFDVAFRNAGLEIEDGIAGRASENR